MLFQFLKYLQPTSYFTLPNKHGNYCYPDISSLSDAVLLQLEADTSYTSELAMRYDASYQAVARGYLGTATTLKHIEPLPVIDEYRFLRKNFHGIWVLYVLLLRLVSFKNPFVEITSFIKTRHVVRVLYHEKPILDAGFKNFISPLIASNPKVSIIIPTLNRYEYLKDVLKDLEQQTYTNFEVIVVDQSEPFQQDFYADFSLDIQLIHQKEKALWLARNTAIEVSKNEYIALSEDDVRVPADWIAMHLKCLDFFKADISAGVFYPKNKTMPEARSYFQYATQFATGNALLPKKVFQTIGLFDRQFEKGRMGDGEFGLRAYKEGLKSISNPLAYCIDVKAADGGLRQFGSWDAFRTKKLFSPKPMPSVLYFFRKYYGTKRTILNLLKSVPPSIVPYKYKGNKKITILAYVSLVLIWPVVLYQVCKSWKLASIKLKEGAIIKRI